METAEQLVRVTTGLEDTAVVLCFGRGSPWLGSRQKVTFVLRCSVAAWGTLCTAMLLCSTVRFCLHFGTYPLNADDDDDGRNRGLVWPLRRDSTAAYRRFLTPLTVNLGRVVTGRVCDMDVIGGCTAVGWWPSRGCVNTDDTGGLKRCLTDVCTDIHTYVCIQTIQICVQMPRTSITYASYVFNIYLCQTGVSTKL